MSSVLDVQETVALLARLRAVTREFADRSDAAAHAARSTRAAAAKAGESALQHERTLLDEQINAAKDERSAAAEHADHQWQARQTKIQTIHQLGRKRALDEIEEREGRRKYQLQKQALDAERKREAAQSAIAQRLEDFRVRLAQSEDRFGILQEGVHQAFRPARGFRRWLSPDQAWPEVETNATEEELLAQLNDLAQETETSLRSFRRRVGLGFFRLVPLWALLGFAVLGYLGAMFVFPRYGFPSVPPREATWVLAGGVVAVLLFFWLARALSQTSARGLAANLAKARTWHRLAAARGEAHAVQDEEHLKAEFERTTGERDAFWQQALQEAAQARLEWPVALDQKKARVLEKARLAHQRRLEQIQARHAEILSRLTETFEQRQLDLLREHEAQQHQLKTDEAQSRESLQTEWLERITPLWRQIENLRQNGKSLAPEWTEPAWKTWTPSIHPLTAGRFARLEVDLAQLTEVSLGAKGLSFPGETHFTLPLFLRYPDHGSLLLETGGAGTDEAVGALNSTIFRLLAASPPGGIQFTLIDPLGLGKNFAGLMHLADYEENQISGRIWTQTSQIEEKLRELNEHIEKVIQNYLRNEYATIAEYNAQAGAAAEKYHVLVVAGFPVNFSETAARRLLNIAVSGARCGVYLLVVWDQRHQAPHDFVPDELRKNATRLTAGATQFTVPGVDLPGLQIHLDNPPPPNLATEFLRKVGQSARDSNRVELPFGEVAPKPEEEWSKSTTDEVRVPIGRAGASKLQSMSLGRGTRQHGLIAGKTGSGKSTLFHVIITSLALWYSPEQVELYLVDFKKGVEFKCYANRRLPHARVVAIESDREFGLSVLQRIDDELRRRGDLFRKAEVQDFPAYRRAAGADSLPRLMLLIDEFQEFFTEEDRISQAAAVLLDRIVRQGRAFGVHVLLGSQTLGGAYTLARATIGQMVLRIALQCNEADAYLIMDESNPAPRLLTRPGEAIYNDMAGALEGNSPFQIVWLSDDERDRYLSELRDRADQKMGGFSSPVVFEGNAPAEISENDLLSAALRQEPKEAPATARIWLGAPNSIKGPTEVVFQRQNGSHLLVVGQSPEATLSLVTASLTALAAEYPPTAAQLILVESSAPGSPERLFLDRLLEGLGRPVLRPNRRELPELLEQLAAQTRSGTEDAGGEKAGPATFLIIPDLHDQKALRQEDDYSLSLDESSGPNPAKSFATLVSEGAPRGIHLIVALDTYNNVTRFIGRRGMSEFQWRVLFQMGPSDSASLIDSPEASKLGLHRALLYNEREGYLEKFRPYALPTAEWLAQAGEHLRSRSYPPPKTHT